MRIERFAIGPRAGMRECHRHPENGVGTKAALGWCAVELDHLPIEAPLIDIVADNGFRDFAVHVRDRLQHAFTAVAFFVAVAQLERLAHARGSPRRHRRPSERAAVERDLNFHCRIAARVQNLPAMHAKNVHK